jgi:predicted nucleotidyltransferase
LSRRFCAQVLAAFAGRVERIVLFGSRVRGDVHKDSDWDFAVYLDHEPGDEEQERLRAIGPALGAETDQEVQSFLLAPERWRATDELACNIPDEGAIIHGPDDTPMIEGPVLQHARDAQGKAKRCGGQAEQAIPEAYETVVHNSYYAMLHAERAALLAVQGRPAPTMAGWSRASRGWWSGKSSGRRRPIWPGSSPKPTTCVRRRTTATRI